MYTILGLALYCILGAVLSANGLTWKTSGYWTIMLIIMAIDLVSYLGAKG